MNNEAEVVHAARLGRRRIHEEQRALPVQHPPSPQGAFGPQQRTPLCAETALQLFRYDMMRRDRGMGGNVQPLQ